MGFVAVEKRNLNPVKTVMKKKILILVETSRTYGRQIIAVSDPNISKALHYIANNVGLQISVKKVAIEAGLSVRTLIRRFHELLGSTPEQEMLRVRMKRAKMLLYETDMKVSAIAENLGYSTSEHFIRAFRREMQMTPMHYRQSLRSGNDE